MTATQNIDIIYTVVDEAPQLASESLLPIIKAFANKVGIKVGTKDISLAGRIISAFPSALVESQRQPDDLRELNEIVKISTANVIKLPNISASIPQLKSAIKELQEQGYNIPDYPDEARTDESKTIRKIYDAIKGSAVNPVLREGNSDRRAATAVKEFARNNPHSMGDWSPESKSHVSSMPSDDFYANEKSLTIRAPHVGNARIEFISKNGGAFTLKTNISLMRGAVLDASFLSATALRKFLKTEIQDAKDKDVLFSIHLKATMMKVSDPILFGHAVSMFLFPVFEKYQKKFEQIGIDPNAGIGDMLVQLKDEQEILDEISACLVDRPPLYMVNSDKGITNLHVPSDVIIDASMPAVIRTGGKGWGPDGLERDIKCVIPDNCYAPVYDEAIRFFKENGALNPKTVGAVANVGLMAQKAEEYGSHPTTFEIVSDGVVRIQAENGDVLIEQSVKKGDIWRACITQRDAIEDWVRLAITRQKITGSHALFWLDKRRAHDAQLIQLVKPILENSGNADKFNILDPREATRETLETITRGEDSIAITGNVLRDYLTDLFPILELGTSAKMLSIVKLMNGGGLFETGAGGSAPKHVEQLVSENHLRWDSLGEFCALGESFKFYADTSGNDKAKLLGHAAEQATQKILAENRSPSRKVGEADNRESHYYFAMYWAEAMGAQSGNSELAEFFVKIAEELRANERIIVAELRGAQGVKVDMGGYFHPDLEKVNDIMRPSKTLNDIVNRMTNS